MGEYGTGQHQCVLSHIIIHVLCHHYTAGKAQLFGPVIVGLIAVISGIIGIVASFRNGSKLMIMYLLSAAFATCASAALLWNSRNTSVGYDLTCSAANVVCDIQASIITFSLVACIASLVAAIIVTAVKRLIDLFIYFSSQMEQNLERTISYLDSRFSMLDCY